MYNILICDDEEDIVSAIRIYLVSEGYKVFEAYDGKQALSVVRANDIHLVIMDIMMPEIDGITAMVKIREISNVPVILLTAKSEETDKILGLNVGADDYITKPFNPVELLARVKSVLRRYMKLGSGEVRENQLSMGGITLDNRAKTVFKDGDPITVTPTEFDILKLLMEHHGQVFSPKEIYNRVWDGGSFGSDSTVSVHIRHLREKLEINPACPRYIKVIWGQGYKFDPDII